MPATEVITDLITKYGMSGVVIVLFGIVIWLIKSLLTMNKGTCDAYLKNTTAFTKFCEVVHSLEASIKENSAETRKLSEKIIEHISKDH